jgi:hypothetical protein
MLFGQRWCLLAVRLLLMGLLSTPMFLALWRAVQPVVCALFLSLFVFFLCYNHGGWYILPELGVGFVLGSMEELIPPPKFPVRLDHTTAGGSWLISPWIPTRRLLTRLLPLASIYLSSHCNAKNFYASFEMLDLPNFDIEVVIFKIHCCSG